MIANDAPRGLAAYLLMLLMLLLAGCADAAPSDSSVVGNGASAEASVAVSSAPSGPLPPRASLSVHARMKEHFTAASALRRALVDVDMEAFRKAASDLSGDQRGADVWDTSLDAMRAAAQRAQDAHDAAAGAASLAEIGGACASCHTMLNSPQLPTPPEPGEGSSSRPHARRYEWAIDVMWTGVAAPSNAEWRRGAQVLVEAEPQGEELVVEGRGPAEFGSTSDAARTAGGVETSDRLRAFEAVLLTCTACHQAWHSSRSQ